MKNYSECDEMLAWLSCVYSVYFLVLSVDYFFSFWRFSQSSVSLRAIAFSTWSRLSTPRRVP